MAITTNSNLIITMESARASAVTLTAVSNDDPGVFTGTHAYAAGDILLLEVQGMTQMNNRVVEVFSVSTTVSFQIKDVGGTAALSTVGMGVFTSGTAKKLTMGTSLTQVGEFAPSGGDSKIVQYPTVTEAVDANVIVGTNAASYTGTLPWDPTDAGQIALKAAFDAGTAKAFRIKYPSGRTCSFLGTVGFAQLPGGSAQGITTTPLSIALQAAATYV
ncbi:MAG: phage tail protein [Firmicutes bacterium]|nr:phage tail protein [Bacillota bacterium]